MRGVDLFTQKLLPLHSYNCSFLNFLCKCTRCSARHCVSWRPILCLWNMYRHQQRCVHKIFHTNPNKFIHLSFYFFKPISTHYPPWRRYTFLSHLTTKSKISARWIKKLVAVTSGVYESIQLYVHVYAP